MTVQPGESTSVGQPRTKGGKLLGRPRGDARVLAVLGDEWMPASEVAERLGLSLGAAYMALVRAERRGVIEHRYHRGYRVRGAS
jgi:predicted Rossmann fold nucleotide-binding protein DprA/Smf involved in DNA uptake